MKFLIVSNPTSGGRRKNQKTLRSLVSFLEQKSLNYELKTTQKKGDGTRIVSESQDIDHLVVVGGDGTINESINGLSNDIPVSIVPAGTGNDFVKNVPLKKSLDDQFDRILNGNDWKIDLGECNGRKFVNGIGIGFDGQIVEDMQTRQVPLLKGHAKYYYHVLTILASYRDRPYQFELDRRPGKERLILMTIGNGTTFGGGFKLMPNAQLDDGLLEVCTIGPIGALRRFLNISKLSSGSHGRLDEVEFHQAKEIRVEASSMLYAHMDGEAIGLPPFDVKVLPGAMTLKV